jgi:hypothetical protein
MSDITPVRLCCGQPMRIRKARLTTNTLPYQGECLVCKHWTDLSGSKSPQLTSGQLTLVLRPKQDRTQPQFLEEPAPTNWKRRTEDPDRPPLIYHAPVLAPHRIAENN